MKKIIITIKNNEFTEKEHTEEEEEEEKKSITRSRST